MNVCVAGKNNIAVNVLEYLLAHNNGRYKLWIICNEKRRELLGFQKSLSAVAKENGVPQITLDDAYNLDDLVFLSMEFDRIVRPDRFKDARLFNIHFSYLPAYKGMYTSAIPILNGETATGVTFHKIDAGIDTGDIIAQIRIPIEKTDTCRDLYLKYIDTGVKLVLDNIEDVLYKKETSYVQKAEGASYYPIEYLDYSHLTLNFNDVAVSVERQIRAFSFREYQMPYFGENSIIACEITDQKSFYKPGTIIKEDYWGYSVATVDFVVVLYKDHYKEMFDACINGNLELVKKICVCRSHISIVEEHGWTPLIVATYNNSIDIVNYLIELGADVRAKNYHGTNLLMYAKEAYLRTGDSTLFSKYIELGLDIGEKDIYGLTICDYIKKEGINELEIILHERGSY